MRSVRVKPAVEWGEKPREWVTVKPPGEDQSDTPRIVQWVSAVTGSSPFWDSCGRFARVFIFHIGCEAGLTEEPKSNNVKAKCRTLLGFFDSVSKNTSRKGLRLAQLRVNQIPAVAGSSRSGHKKIRFSSGF